MRFNRYYLLLVVPILFWQIDASAKDKKVASTDNLFTMKIPENWPTGLDLHGSANFQAKSASGEFFLIAITESKGNFAGGLEDVTAITTKNMLDKLTDAEISQPKQIKLDGRPALQYEITGTISNVNITYIQTTIAGDSYFYQILGWATRSQISKYRKGLERILKSFRINENAHPDQSDAEVALKTITAVDSLCQISVPSDWIVRDDLTDAANLQVSDVGGQQYLIVLTESKLDFSEMTLENYLHSTTENILSSLNDSTVSDTVRLTINGKPALQVEIGGRIEHVNLTYAHTVVEDQDYFYQVMTWSGRSSFDQRKALTNQILQSFKASESVDLAQKNCLWRLQTETNTVFLLGSIHVLKEQYYPLNPVIEQAFDESEILVMEVHGDSLEGPAMQQLVTSLGSYTGEQNIENDLSKSTFELYKQELERSSLPLTQFAKFRPWLAALTLPILKLQQSGISAEHGVDRYFFKRAKEAGKQVWASNGPGIS